MDVRTAITGYSKYMYDKGISTSTSSKKENVEKSTKKEADVDKVIITKEASNNKFLYEILYSSKMVLSSKHYVRLRIDFHDSVWEEALSNVFYNCNKNNDHLYYSFKLYIF